MIYLQSFLKYEKVVPHVAMVTTYFSIKISKKNNIQINLKDQIKILEAFGVLFDSAPLG